MGNSNSSVSTPPPPPLPPSTIDLGHLHPQSHVYASSLQEYNTTTVQSLITQGRLAPFFLGIDYQPPSTLEGVLQALAEAHHTAYSNLEQALHQANQVLQESSSTKKSKDSQLAHTVALAHRDRLLRLVNQRDKEGELDQSQLALRYLHQAIECPICFLHYPPPLVHTRCCDQPLCTECFVQIKRIDPTATHLESEPAACPFCMEVNFGVIYQREERDQVPGRPGPAGAGVREGEGKGKETVKPKGRRKSFAHTEKTVITTDMVHPDWETKLNAIKATAARRANRRIVFRQVGDRLIPVGITSGRSADGGSTTMSTATLPPGFASQIAAAMDPTDMASLTTREGRRAARRRNEEMANFLAGMGLGVGAELEEMMVLEAIRLSMVDDEERKKKSDAEAATATATSSAIEGGGEGAEVAETSTQGATRNLLIDVEPPTLAPLDLNDPSFNRTSLLTEAMQDSPSTSTLLIPSLLPLPPPPPPPPHPSASIEEPTSSYSPPSSIHTFSSARSTSVSPLSQSVAPLPTSIIVGAAEAATSGGGGGGTSNLLPPVTAEESNAIAASVVVLNTAPTTSNEVRQE